MGKPKIKKNTKSITTYLTEDIYNQLVDITQEQDLSFNDWIRDAINTKLNTKDIEYINKESDKLIEEWKQKIKDYDRRVAKERYDNWVGKKTYFNGMRGY